MKDTLESDGWTIADTASDLAGFHLLSAQRGAYCNIQGLAVR